MYGQQSQVSQLDLLYYSGMHMSVHMICRCPIVTGDPPAATTHPPTHPNCLGVAKLIGPGQPHAVSDVEASPC